MSKKGNQTIKGKLTGNLQTIWKIGKENLTELGLEPETFGLSYQCSSIWAIQMVVLQNSQLVFARVGHASQKQPLTVIISRDRTPFFIQMQTTNIFVILATWYVNPEVSGSSSGPVKVFFSNFLIQFKLKTRHLLHVINLLL